MLIKNRKARIAVAIAGAWISSAVVSAATDPGLTISLLLGAACGIAAATMEIIGWKRGNTPQEAGQQIRALSNIGSYVKKGEVLTIAEVPPLFAGEDPDSLADKDGDYWAINSSGNLRCVGRPGVLFELV